jgi:hypothetical protein
MLPRVVAPFLIFLTLSSMVLASALGKKVCTAEEARLAETETNQLRDWGSVHRSYVRFSHCDDGSIAEGYSDAVGKLLADHWDQFSRLAQLVSSDKGFVLFVTKHVDRTIPSDVLLKISKNAYSRCPSGREGLCKKIAQAAKND